MLEDRGSIQHRARTFSWAGKPETPGGREIEARRNGLAGAGGDSHQSRWGNGGVYAQSEIL